jgi:hypothetical protein
MSAYAASLFIHHHDCNKCESAGKGQGVGGDGTELGGGLQRGIGEDERLRELTNICLLA